MTIMFVLTYQIKRYYVQVKKSTQTAYFLRMNCVKSKGSTK